MQQGLADRTTHKHFLQTFTSGMFPVKRAFLSLGSPKNCQAQPQELPMIGNMLHLAVCSLSASKLLRTWSYSTSSTHLNYGKFSTLAYQAAVKKECRTWNASEVLNTSLSLPQRIPPFIECNCSIQKRLGFLPLKGCTYQTTFLLLQAT